MILEDLPWILVRTVPPLVSPLTSSDRGGCKHRKLPSLQEYHSTTWPTLLLLSSRHSQISTMHKNIDKWSKSYTARKSYNGKFRNCIKKIFHLFCLVVYIDIFIHIYILCFITSFLYSVHKHWQDVKITKLYKTFTDFFCPGVNSFGRGFIFFVFPTLYCNLTPTYRKAWNKQQAESINCLL